VQINIEVNKNREVLGSVNIDKLLFNEDPIDLLPVKLIVTDRCMFLLHHYRGGSKAPDLGDLNSDYVSIIKDSDIKILDARINFRWIPLSVCVWADLLITRLF